MNKSDETKVIVLGGLGEVGRNMYCVMHKDEIIILDAGVSFAGDLLGIDYVLPDYSFLKQNEDKIKALFITHGHEDHIGAIPFLLQMVNIPAIYAPNQAKELIDMKLKDRNIRYDNLYVYNDQTTVKFKYFEIDFIRTTHSIPDSHGIVVKTPNGTIVTTGDFKFDLTPIGPMADLYKMATIGHQGVDLLISDSTNALNEGMSISESRVDDTLTDIFDKYKYNRIIIATFASNIYRLKHIFESCYKHNRKICVFGRSMENNIDISIKGGYIDHKELLIRADEANNLKPGEVTILCTGSQGEPLAALSRIANGTHKQITLMNDDLVVFSSSPIPGNAASINRIINKLYLKGVKVYTNSEFSDIHTSGHAKAEELKLMLRLIKPEYFMPMHGEYRMLKQHKDLAISCGMNPDNVFVLKNGEELILDKNGVHKGGNVISGDVYVDGSRIGDVGSVVIKDRKLMSKDGILVTILNINVKTKELLIKPNVTTRGFVLVNENAELINKIERKISEIVKNNLASKNYNYLDLKNQIILELSPFINNLTGRHPIILPVIMEVK